MRSFYNIEVKRYKNYIKSYPIRSIIGILSIVSIFFLINIPGTEGGNQLSIKLPSGLHIGFMYIYVMIYGVLSLFNRGRKYKFSGLYGDLLILCSDNAKKLFVLNHISRRVKQILGLIIIILITLMFNKKNIDIKSCIGGVAFFVCFIVIELFFRFLCNDHCRKRKKIISIISILYTIFGIVNSYILQMNIPIWVEPLRFMNQFIGNILFANDYNVSIVSALVVTIITIMLFLLYYRKIALYAYERKNADIKSSEKSSSRSVYNKVRKKLHFLPLEAKVIVSKELTQLWYEKVPLLNALIYPFIISVIMVISSKVYFESFYIGYMLTVSYFTYMISLYSIPRENIGIWILKICRCNPINILKYKYTLCCGVGFISNLLIYVIYYIIGVIFYKVEFSQIFILLLWNFIFIIPISSAYGFLTSTLLTYRTIVKKGERNYSFGALDSILLFSIIYMVVVPGYITSGLVINNLFLNFVAILYEVLVITLMFWILRKRLLKTFK